MFTKGSWGFLTTSSLISDFSLNNSNLISSTFVPWLCSAWIRCNLLSLITAVALHGITALWRWHLKYEDLWKSPNDKYLLVQDFTSYGIRRGLWPWHVLRNKTHFRPCTSTCLYTHNQVDHVQPRIPSSYNELKVFSCEFSYLDKWPKWDLICFKGTEIKFLLARR